jgi:hypothetical protein
VGHDAFVRIPSLLAGVLFVVTACADAPPPIDDGPATGPAPTGIPDIAEIVCEADGTTTVLTPEVVVQPDGIHVHAVSRLDEPAELIGLRMDVDAGETTFVTTSAPGGLEVGCNPFSQHEPGGDEPTLVPMEVLDPEGLFVEGEVECPGTASSMIADFFEEPLDDGPVPLEVARESIRGLQPGDEILHLGYPEQGGRQVAVMRDETIVATFDFVTFDGEKWQIASNYVCSSTGLR